MDAAMVDPLACVGKTTFANIGFIIPANNAKPIDRDQGLSL